MQIPAEARELIAGGALAHWVTIDKDGGPYVTCAWAAVEGDELLIATLHDQRKLGNIRRNPRVALSFEASTANAVGMKHYLVVYGTATITEGGAPELLQQLAYAHVGPGVRFPPMPDPPPGYVTRIAVDRVAGMGPWTVGR